MQAILGPFHPHLENSLVEEILKYKSTDPLCPLLILVPSDALRRYLKVLLARERNLSFVNLQLLTFYQLSAKLFAEAKGVNPPVLRDDLFLEEALRQIIRARQPGTAAFSGVDERAGGCAALWQSLRDLRDGLVQPDVALEALRENQLDPRTKERTANLLVMLQTLVRFCREHGISDHSTLDIFAIAQAPASGFLRQFARIFYYGFYDLTQAQVDLVHAVGQAFATTVFFPLLKTQPAHEGWQFAERFYSGYILGRAGSEETKNLLLDCDQPAQLPQSFAVFDRDPDRQYQTLPANWHCRIINTFGIDDEISAVAKEILLLSEQDGIAFDQIGVVARTLDGYGAKIREVFAQHQIPVAGSVEEPLAQYPLTKAAILLMNLAAKDYLRSDVIDLLSSPYFRSNGSTQKPRELRPDLWDLATRELAICKGMKEWQRIDRYAVEGMKLSQISDDEERRFIEIPAAQLRALATILQNLDKVFSQLPAHASWTDYADSWKQLFGAYLRIQPEPSRDFNATEILISNQIIETLDRISGLDLVAPNVSLCEFSETLQHWLERSTIVETDKNLSGVAVSSASAARGIKFRALFIVGMNEGVFPRTIREDAFLRDRDREVLERDLGYKVSQKLAAFDEEKLVFTLLVNSVTDRLYCSYQRAEESGRVLAPSWYLAELKRALSGAPQGQFVEQTIPRSTLDKVSCRPFAGEEALLPAELAIRLNLSGTDSRSLVEAAHLSSNLYEQGLKTILALDLSTDRLDVFDGIIQTPARHWRRFSNRGLSPTALELYGRCPFQYFARQVLGLQSLETPETVMGPGAAELGELGHLILKLTYQELIESGYFASNGSRVAVDAIISAAAQKTFTEYEAENPIGYPLMWETLRETLTQLIREVVRRDLEELACSGYVPLNLEIGIGDRLPPDWPDPLNTLAIHGRMDRIDIDPSANRMRVVDYKFKFGAKPSPEDNDLSRSALRGQRLQPPLYSLLAQAKRRRDGLPDGEIRSEASFYYIASRWSEGPLVIKSFNSDELSGKSGEEIRHTIAQLAKGIRSGHFFMQPGEHCPHCEVAEICRKNHPPSLWRTENDPITAPHRQLRQKELKKC
ncbi:MAG TPA: PD-(D/E)XK nuclease family protein [Candidatus Binatia bacterium]